MDIKASINAARKGFEESFSSGDFYNKQTQDSEHLERIMDFLPIKDGMKVLDLGAGSGYMSFPIAKRNAACEIVGLDIVSNTLGANRIRAENEGLGNLSFVCYDGIDLPFEMSSFDMIITRYALHHFPDIDHSIGEAARVLKKGGSFFLSDPCPNDCDCNRFVDDYMQLKKDGHIKFYTKDEWRDICGKWGMEMTDSFRSNIRFPRKRETAYGYEEVLKKHDRSVIESYDLIETDTEIYITEQVNNILFVKK
ncbi:MAG: class I SAM-dependent methyltransferase [Huintestinicola sp.]